MYAWTRDRNGHVNRVTGFDQQKVPSVIMNKTLLVGQGYSNMYMQSRVREGLWLDSYEANAALLNNWHEAFTMADPCGWSSRVLAGIAH